MGRLHTRYSPVRRSPPASYPAALPLDLHVLSLSLAFILSQDQTLRCCLSFFLFFSDKKHRPLSPDRWLLLDGGFRPLCLSCLTVALFQCPLCSPEQSLRRLAGRPRFGVASAKVQQILLPTKLFYNFFVLKNIFFGKWLRIKRLKVRGERLQVGGWRVGGWRLVVRGKRLVTGGWCKKKRTSGTGVTELQF